MSCAIKPDLSRLLRLVVITSRSDERGHEEIASAALDAGCRAVQLRDKELSDRDFLAAAAEIRRMCRERHALFFVNDRVDVAAVVGADGVHLGVEDLDVGSARRLLPAGSLIGFSPESLEEARRAVSDGADYLGVGPVFGTATKADAGRAIGLEGLARYCRARVAPVIAVGGIDARNAASAIRAGAAGVAVVSAVGGAPDVGLAVREILSGMEKA